MQIEVTSKDFTVTPCIYNRLKNQLQKLQKFDIPLITPHVILRKEKERYLIEANLPIPNATLFASHEHKNLYTAIHGVRHKLERQMNRYLGKSLATRFAPVKSKPAVN